MNATRTARLIVRGLAAVGFILSLLYATAAPSDFTTGPRSVQVAK